MKLSSNPNKGILNRRGSYETRFNQFTPIDGDLRFCKRRHRPGKRPYGRQSVHVNFQELGLSGPPRDIQSPIRLSNRWRSDENRMGLTPHPLLRGRQTNNTNPKTKTNIRPLIQFFPKKI
jgi:hypothetical protein